MHGWGWRMWSITAVTTLGAAVLVAVPTAIIPTPWFGRGVPVTWWSYPTLAVAAVLSGLLIASYVRAPPPPRPESRRARVGAALSWFAVGCPVCNDSVRYDRVDARAAAEDPPPPCQRQPKSDQVSAVERTTRTIPLLHLPRRDARTRHHALAVRMNDLPPWLLRSITWDQGTEMARHTDITAELGIPIYFCDAHAPWQRGTNENANGLLRQYFPKRTDLNVHGPEHLRAVEDEINARPRMVLADRTPADLFEALLASPDQPPLRR